MTKPPDDAKTILTPADCKTAVLFQLTTDQLRNYLDGDDFNEVLPDFDDAAYRVLREVLDQKGRRFIMLEIVEPDT